MFVGPHPSARTTASTAVIEDLPLLHTPIAPRSGVNRISLHKITLRFRIFSPPALVAPAALLCLTPARDHHGTQPAAHNLNPLTRTTVLRVRSLWLEALIVVQPCALIQSHQSAVLVD